MNTSMNIPLSPELAERVIAALIDDPEFDVEMVMNTVGTDTSALAAAMIELCAGGASRWSGHMSLMTRDRINQEVRNHYTKPDPTNDPIADNASMLAGMDPFARIGELHSETVTPSGPNLTIRDGRKGVS